MSNIESIIVIGLSVVVWWIFWKKCEEDVKKVIVQIAGLFVTVLLTALAITAVIIRVINGG